MKARVNRKVGLLAALMVGGVIAASPTVDAAAPWFRPGGLRPVPQGKRDGDHNRDRDKDRRRNMYSEQRFIRQLYEGFLNRPPSSNELRVWSGRLGRDATPTDLVQDFMDSDEYFIRQTYLGLLGREPDPSGMNTYMNSLESGESRADVVEALLSSDEFRKRLR